MRDINHFIKRPCSHFMPFVTVIMSAYQAAATLKRAVASVKAQVFQDWELIVVNDGSTGTPPVALPMKMPGAIRASE